MRKIQKIDLTKTHNEEHFQFMTEMKKLLAEAFIQRSSEKMDPLWMRYRDLWKKEDIGIEIIRKSALTEPLAVLDKYRDNIFIGMKEIVYANSRSIRSELVEAARKLSIVLNHYKKIPNRPYNEETASVYNLIQEIKDNYFDEIETLGLETWFNDLKATNREMEDLINERYDEHIGNQIVNVREVRLEIDEVYKQIVDVIEAMNLLSDDDAYGTLIERMNERITYYKNTLAQRKGRSDAGKEEEK